MPRARSRSSFSARFASSPAWRTSSTAAGSPSSARCSAIRRFSASATSRCCAPSWRSRSMRRRSASAAAMMRERASCELGHLGGQLRVGVRAEQLRREPAVQAAERAQRRDPDEQDQRAERHSAIASPSVSTPIQSIQSPSGSARSRAGANSRPSPKPSTATVTVKLRIPSGSWSSRKARSFQVAGSAEAGREARPPAPAHRVGPVRARDLRCRRGARSGGARGRRASATRTPLPTSTGMPISVIAVPKPNEIAVTRKRELRHAERQREQQVQDPPVRAGVENAAE